MKHSFFLLLGCLVWQASMAQASFSVGLKGGLNFSQIHATNFKANYDMRTGYHAGLYTRIKIMKIAIQPEVLFSRLATSFTFNSQDYNSNYDYFTVPVLLKWYLIGGVNLFAGPQIGFLSKVDHVLDNTNGQLRSGADAKRLMKDNDMSVSMGAGFDLPFGLSIEARYNLGLTDTSKQANSVTFKSQVIQVSAGYRLFKIGKK